MKIRSLFVNEEKAVRTGWIIVLAAGLYLLADGGVYQLYWYLYRTMMGIWGVTGENIARAPAAVRFLYSWSNVIGQILISGAVCCAAVWLGRACRTERKTGAGESGRAFGAGVGVGAALTAGVWAALMLTGSVRLGWRLTRPEITVNTLALLITTLSSACAESMFVYGAFRQCVKKRLPAWAAPVVGVVWSVLFLLLDGVAYAPALIGGGLAALAVWGMAERFGTAAAAGFLFAGSFLEQAVFGFAGAQAALYETYPVNMYWLNGGSGGVGSGVMMMAALAGLAAWLYGIGRLVGIRRGKSKSPS